MKLTHSTSLTKPRGSLSGDKLSRNPVIMIDPVVVQKENTPALDPVVAELWMLVQKGGKKGELSDRVTWFSRSRCKKWPHAVISSDFYHPTVRKKWLDSNLAPERDRPTSWKRSFTRLQMCEKHVSVEKKNLWLWCELSFFCSVGWKPIELPALRLVVMRKIRKAT